MSTVYEQPFSVVQVKKQELPAGRQSPVSLGGHVDGCRLGFDLGASDFKVAALQAGEVVFSEEIPWQPQEQPDPAYHYQHLQAGLKKRQPACQPSRPLAAAPPGFISTIRLELLLFSALFPGRSSIKK